MKYSFDESIELFIKQFPNIEFSNLILNNTQMNDSNLRYTNYKNGKKYIYKSQEKKWYEYTCHC